MRSPETPEPDEPWLTVAEVADELRVNPATVRLWISKGALRATRVGPRKLLIRRPDLEQMLESRDPEQLSAEREPPLQARRPRETNGPPRSISRLSGAEPATSPAVYREIQQAVEQIQISDETWARAQDASENAPPDAGFPHRLRALADAADGQARSVTAAGEVDRLVWRPTSEARDVTISHELRPGANRPGPSELWAQFDRSVQRLGIAMEGHSWHTIGAGWADLADVMHEIANILLDEAPARREQRR